MHQVSRIARMSSRAYTHDFQFLNAYRSATKFCNCSQLKFVVSSDDFVILMVGASRHHERGWNAANTWLKQIPYYYIFSDKSISSIRNYVTLPCLLNKSKRSDADHRQLWGLQWLYLRAPFLFEKKWFIFCDDDTWINVPFLKRYLSNFDENLPLSIGMIFDDLFVRRLAYHQGGAGVIVSNKAAKHLLTNLYGSCAHNFFNDVTLGTCFYKTGVLKISSDKLWWDPPFEPGENITSPFHSLTFVNKISYHHFSDYKVMREMTCLSAKFWNETVPSLC